MKKILVLLLLLSNSMPLTANDTLKAVIGSTIIIGGFATIFHYKWPATSPTTTSTTDNAQTTSDNKTASQEQIEQLQQKQEENRAPHQELPIILNTHSEKIVDNNVYYNNTIKQLTESIKPITKLLEKLELQDYFKDRDTFIDKAVELGWN
jgi:hypothetical protein